MDSLLKLPEGATYRNRSGRASVEVAKRGDTVYVMGACDSLQRRVDYYESLYHTARDALEEREAAYDEERRQRTDPANVAIAFFLAGIFAGATTIIIISKHKRQ